MDREQYMREEFRRRRLFFPFNEFPHRKPRFIVDGLLPAGRVALLAGDPKSGKTALATAIALAVAKGEPFAGMKTEQSSVLWLACEESFSERSELLEPISAEFADRPFEEPDSCPDGIPDFPVCEPPLYTCYEHMPVDDENAIGDLQCWISGVGAKLLIVDPLHGAHSGRSLTDGWAARKTLRRLKALCNTTGITALVLHHLTKSRKRARVAESVQLAAIVGTVMILSSHPVAAPETRIVKLESTGRGAHANRTYHFESSGPLDYRLTEPTASQTIPTVPTIKSRILDALSGAPASARQIAKSFELNLIFRTQRDVGTCARGKGSALRREERLAI
ncbi:MAG: AAA family ATPase [Armatimonadota bacterium]|nr:AAA family ATPase [Armatimonadota bacterium]